MLRAELAMFDVDALAYAAMGEKFLDEVKVGKSHPAYLEHDEVRRDRTEQAPARAVHGRRRLDRARMGQRGNPRRRPAREWLRTKANSIEGGTSEVMLGVVAKRILELPGA